MKCMECGWCKKENDNRVCRNYDSPFFNEVFPENEVEKKECECGETQEAIDYRNLTPWQFASKYYM